MREKILSGFTLQSSLSLTNPTSIRCTNPQGWVYTLAALSPSMLKLTLTGPDHPHPVHDNVRWSAPPVGFQSVRQEEGGDAGIVRLSMGEVDLTLDVADLTLKAEVPWMMPGSLVGAKDKLSPTTVYSDLPHRTFSSTPHGITHYSLLPGLPGASSALHLGMGEKAAPLDLTNRRFEVAGKDAANYDAWRTDPLYKHTPWLVTLRKGGGYAVGVYNASNSDGVWNVGCEVDDPWGRYKFYAQDVGGLEEYLVFGRTGQEVLTDWARLVGFPMLPPRHWLGYLASSMGYAESDSPPAQQLLEDFPRKCREEDIPCSAMHLSSGYTQVFTLNTHRYPSFPRLFEIYHAAGLRIAPNIKPFVLRTHPSFPELLRGGAFVKDEQGGLAETRIWSALPGENAGGAWLDMTSREGRDWWYSGVKGLIAAGADAMWNDNDEFSLHDDAYQCTWSLPSLPSAGTGPKEVGLVGRMTHTQLLGQTSYEALLDADGRRRPFIVTRSANVGTLQWCAGTWSGDNWTSWETLRGNVAMCLNAGMSLMHSYGHDVGGFGGPLPTIELFTRWVQSCVYNPRFCIHSFKPTLTNKAGTSTINEPWMHPSVTHLVRASIKRRYELLPYLYALHWESHELARPLNTWLGWGEFESDEEVYSRKVLEGHDFWLGTGRLLVASVCYESQIEREVYLPRTEEEPKRGYYLLSAPYSYHSPGWVTVPTPLENIAVFARVGSVIPLGKDKVTVTSREGIDRVGRSGVKAVLDDELGADGLPGVVAVDDWRGVELYPPPASASPVEEVKRYSWEWTEDDGESLKPDPTRVKVEYWVEFGEVVVRAERGKGWEVAWGSTLWVTLPRRDERSVRGARQKEEKGRVWWEVKVVRRV
ncbi:glycoside hydrolase family 31 protein [Calocera cornea HHB12733]|uniref:Glycoside hydrolase family 31 protein n=1 Tax=Calocera cornea HHB12733 TaxID=1353952 RepID=A0A165IGF0_9BASI|nr:glycoside hydrolase family 31 protein [Calocera cornea HHB12733]